MGRQSIKSKVIIRAGTKSAARSDGKREFVSLLETVNAVGQVIPPFIVWTGNVHTESCYPKYANGSFPTGRYEGIFAISKCGYMDVELGMEYMKQHFEPQTRQIGADGKVQTLILIVDGHASHMNYSILSWAIEKDIHVICLLSKSTHILQPIDVACFGLLQRTYERNQGLWVIANPLGLVNKVVFLEILYKTREEVYTEETIMRAWRAAQCWPVDINLARGNITASITTTATMTMTTTTTTTTTMTMQSQISSNDSGDVTVNDANPTLDTALRLRQVTRKFKEQIPLDCDIRKDLLDSIYNFVDIASEKVCQYRDIAPRAHTLNTLHNGKGRLKVTGRRRHILGAARGMTEKEIRSGLEQLFQAEEKNTEKERLTEERKKAAEMKRIVNNAAATQWRLEKLEYEMAKDRWELECGTIKDD